MTVLAQVVVSFVSLVWSTKPWAQMSDDEKNEALRTVTRKSVSEDDLIRRLTRLGYEVAYDWFDVPENDFAMLEVRQHSIRNRLPVSAKGAVVFYTLC